MISWLSGFLFNPWMAAGAGAVASPILIHILSRRRYRRVRWAAMDFLLDAYRRNRRRVRLEQLILLALRCLVVLLLALAFARPFLTSGLFAGLIGGSQTEHIIVLDDSFSMSAVSRSATTTGARLASFDAGKDAVEAIGRIVSETASSDSISLYVTSRPDEPVLSLPNASDENRVRLTETLAGLTSTQRGGNWDAAMRSVAKQIASSAGRANAVVYAVSDFQRSDWRDNRSDGDGGTKGPLAPLAALNDERNSIRCVLVGVGQQAAGNIAVTSIGADRPQAVAGVPTRFVVGVANHSTEALRDVELGVAIDGRRLPPLVIREIMPDETAREPVEVTFDQDGANFVEVELVGAASSIDSVALDNRRSKSVDVAGAIRVLIVDGEPSSDQYRDEAFLLKTALRPAGRATSGIDVTVVEEGEIEESELAAYQVVILANVGRVARSANEKLRAFVDAGGGLIVFAGDLVDVADYNASMYDGGHGLLPLPIIGPAEAPPGTDAIAISSWDAAHSMLRAFEGPTAELLRQVRIDAYLRVEEVAKTAVDDAATSSAIAESTPGTAVVIARLNDAFQSPLIVEKAVGRGRTVFVATSADQEWNDWASNFSYLPLVLEMVQYIARSAASERDVVVGEALKCEIDPTVVEPSVALRTPAYPTDPEIMLTASGATSGSGGDAANAGQTTSVATFGDTDQSGRYQFRLKRLRGGTIQQFASVNPDSAESNLKPATAEELRGASDTMRIEIIDDPAMLASSADNGRSEFWWPLMLMAAALLMVEHGLAWRFGTNT
ncbi:MAG: BatA domain-containing protein [Phycisphaerales bacterium]|nr:BatA domain-containing protein [Phycisphaerales bacterium]MCB9858552.1 BatA domain-containing protein [Phycisphaerales bacterium]